MTDVPSAVKALTFEKLFQRERDAYVRLKKHDIQRIGIFNIPSLINVDESLWIIEMTFVAAPYVVDFAGAYVDTPPPYYWDSDMIQARESCSDHYGSDWADVAMLLDELREKHGIFLNDIRPRNIKVRQ